MGTPLRRAVVLSSLLIGCNGDSHPRDLAVDLGAVDALDTVDALTLPPVDSGGDLAFTGCDSMHACGIGLRCFQGSCIADHGVCVTNGDCQDDTECIAEPAADGGVTRVCIPWGSDGVPAFDTACTTGFAISQFQPPVLKCSWDQANTALGTALVADMDGDGKPEITFRVFALDQIAVIHGDDCSTYAITASDLAQASELAVADLDGDGVPEIIGVNKSLLVEVFDNKGNTLALSPVPFVQAAPPTFINGPSIANVDAQGPPEIVMGGQVLRYHKGQNQLEVVYTVYPPEDYWGQLSVVADLDGDGMPELIAGTTIYDGATGVDKTKPAMMALSVTGAFTAVADFNQDHKPDLVLVQTYLGGGMEDVQVSVYDYANDTFLLGPFRTSFVGGGPPTVVDLDGDGIPEFIVSSRDTLQAYDLKCVPKNGPAQCPHPSGGTGLLWTKAIQDKSSGVTTVSAFDFNGDGVPELAYRDECWLRIYDNLGHTLAAYPVSSSTGTEMPTIGDLDGDGHAEIAVTSDDNPNNFDPCPNTPEADTGVPWTGYTNGVFVFQDPLNRWMPARRVWNQHSYHVTNINDDLTVPVVESASWLAENTYRAQAESHSVALPDATAGAPVSVDMSPDDCSVAWTLRASLCNRGAGPLPITPGTFYSTDPGKPGATVICTASTTSPLMPGACQDVQCDWQSPPTQAVPLWFRADDDGKGNHPITECDTTNDLLITPSAQCGGAG